MHTEVIWAHYGLCTSQDSKEGCILQSTSRWGSDLSGFKHCFFKLYKVLQLQLTVMFTYEFIYIIINIIVNLIVGITSTFNL